MAEEKQQENKLSIQEVKQRGGIAFPLDYEDISALKNSFVWVGQVILSNGTATIYNSNITATSVAVATHSVFAGTIGVLSCQVNNGRITITSSSNTDNSLVSVVIFF